MTIDTNPASATGAATAPATPPHGVRFSTEEIKRRIDAMFEDFSTIDDEYLEN
ncbi:hypothetical protein [Rhodococcus chondri]|uniref:Uncharacterized protein n=1 Tax=Rhodococcus chondri TaxID=3065941 RepID=A0ABU7JSS7_9NOCA|nr:hypothetical protein [Rhodococcus sp. CC-R104]MEE2033077.1 hypothetical protein [Rhodococcus sp. CC-R104]